MEADDNAQQHTSSYSFLSTLGAFSGLAFPPAPPPPPKPPSVRNQIEPIAAQQRPDPAKHARARGGRGASRPTHLASTWRTGRIGRAGHETLAWRAPRRRGRWGGGGERQASETAGGDGRGARANGVYRWTDRKVACPSRARPWVGILASSGRLSSGRAFPRDWWVHLAHVPCLRG
jgi:hypothetical protein